VLHPLIVSLNERQSLIDEWDALADRCTPAPFLRPGWISAWMQAYGSGTLELLCARQAGLLVGVLPLRRRGGAVVSPTNFHTPAFGLLAETDQARDALADAVFVRRPRQVAISFLDDQRCDTVALQAAARERRYNVVVRELMRSPYIPLQTDWESYERQLGRNLRRDLRRNWRKLEDHGEVSIDHYGSGEDLRKLLDDVFFVESRSWKAETRTAIVSEPRTKHFYEQVTAWARERASLSVSILRVDGQPVAMELGIEEASVHFAIKGSYDETYRPFSPGKLLMHAVIRNAFTKGLKRVELLGAEDQYKRLWATESHIRMQLHAYTASPIGWLQWTADAHGRPLARRAGLGRLRRRWQRLRREAGA
jgi:CelD/BcsL family acetyltransferase involved in cellulose biosynthesis